MKEVLQYILPLRDFSYGRDRRKSVPVFVVPEKIVHVSSSGEKITYIIPRELNFEQMLQLGDYLACKRLTELAPVMERVGWKTENLSKEEKDLIQEALGLFNETGMDGRYAQMAIEGILMKPPEFLIPVLPH